MILFKAIKLTTKVITIVAAAKTGIKIYKKAKQVHSGYKKVKTVKNGAKKLLKDVTDKLPK